MAAEDQFSVLLTGMIGEISSQLNLAGCASEIQFWIALFLFLPSFLPAFL
jgi:hypothetical protein